MSGGYRRKEFASIHVNAKIKRFYDVPESMQTVGIKRAVDKLFNGKSVVCINPQGSLSIFSEAGFNMEMTKGSFGKD